MVILVILFRVICLGFLLVYENGVRLLVIFGVVVCCVHAVIAVLMEVVVVVAEVVLVVAVVVLWVAVGTAVLWVVAVVVGCGSVVVLVGCSFEMVVESGGLVVVGVALKLAWVRRYF